MPMQSPTSPDKLPLAEGVRLIVSNADGLVALDKPVGVMSHPNAPEDRRRSLLDADYDYDEEAFLWEDAAGVAHRAWLINRLDSPTSGVILLALNAELSATLKQQFITNKVSKTYYALVKHPMQVPAGAWSDKLKKDVYHAKGKSKRVQMVSAKTRYQAIKSPTGGFPVSLIKLTPVTGRTHQLRVQCQKHGHPIVGDRTYGSFDFNREVAKETGQKRMMLHSALTKLRYSFHGKMRDFEAASDLPEAFATVLRFRPGINHGRQSPSTSTLAGRRFRR